MKPSVTEIAIYRKSKEITGEGSLKKYSMIYMSDEVFQTQGQRRNTRGKYQNNNRKIKEPKIKFPGADKKIQAY